MIKVFRLFTILFIIVSQEAWAQVRQSIEHKMQFISIDAKQKVVKPVIQLDFSEVGIASWYGRQFKGKKTASGDIFNPELMTAAHRYLPLNSMVKVTNLANNKSIKVLVNDRGPYTKQPRIIDLSKKAAQALEFCDKGLTQVKVEYLHTETMDLSSTMPPRKRSRLMHELEKVSAKKWMTIIQSKL